MEMTYAYNVARKYHPAIFRHPSLREDAIQTVALAELLAWREGGPPTKKDIANSIHREFRKLYKNSLGTIAICPVGQASQRRKNKWTAYRLATAGIDVQIITKATGLHRETILEYTRQYRTPEQVSQLRSDGGIIGSRIGNVTRWGDHVARRQKAAQMAGTATLAEIALACGYKSVSGVHYALKGKGKT